MATTSIDTVLRHIHTLLYEIEPPDLPRELAGVPMLADLCATLLDIREVTLSFSKGDFSRNITSGGVISGHLKGLQADLTRGTRQAGRVENADVTQCVSFIGEFSEAFNNMTTQLESTMRILEQSEARFRHMACHDALTGAFNRSFFMMDGEQLLREAIAAGEPFGLILVDMDRFKNVNDVYGHQAGDAVLQHVVALLGKTLRDSDPVYRYGGEEFITIFKGIPLDVAQRIAERARLAIETSPVSWEGSYLPVTASFGVCVTDPEAGNDYSFGHILKTADANMYAAKAAGRNSVVSTICDRPSHRRRKMDG